MITWSFSKRLIALAMLALAACDEAPGSTASAALTQARMAQGAVMLVPPPGYCIDRRSLKQRFAIMARCDTLGGSSGGGAPLGILIASFSPATGEGTLPAPEVTAQALELQNVSAQRKDDSAVIFRAEGPAPVEGMSSRHWRANALVGGQIMGLALYGPEGGPAAGEEGRAMLNQVISASRQGS